MDYCCKICKKDFKQKSNLVSHMRRKKPCINYEIDINTSQNKIITIAQKVNLITPENTILYTIEQENSCIYCNKKFSRKFSLNRHLNNRCKQNNIIKQIKLLESNNNELKEELSKSNIEKDKLKEEISLVLSKTKNTKRTKEISKIQTQNNNSNIQNQTNITINFGEEDMKRLTESEILTSLKE